MFTDFVIILFKLKVIEQSSISSGVEWGKRQSRAHEKTFQPVNEHTREVHRMVNYNKLYMPVVVIW
jgi:hypothetical protein